MSECYSYVVKSKDFKQLNDLLKQLSIDFEIWPINTLETLYARQLGYKETITELANGDLIVNWHDYATEAKNNDLTDYYWIDSTVTTRDDRYLKIAKHLMLVCEKVTFQSETERVPDANEFYLVNDYLKQGN